MLLLDHASHGHILCTIKKFFTKKGVQTLIFNIPIDDIKDLEIRSFCESQNHENTKLLLFLFY